jgi:MFS family permease
LSFFSRAISGFGDGLILISCPAIIYATYPEQANKYMGYFVVTIGFSLLIGPMIGAIVYSYLDYANTFYFFFFF